MRPLNGCAKMAWNVKGFGGPSFLILHSFYRYRVLVVLQQTQAISISKHVVTILVRVLLG
jgi:hypothetical protein